MPLYGAAHVQLGPGQYYELFTSSDSLTPTVSSMSFLFLAATGASTRSFTKTFQVLLGTKTVPVSGSCTINIQSSLVDIDAAYTTIGTLSVASGYASIATDIGNSLYYRLQLTALTTATQLFGMVNV